MNLKETAEYLVAIGADNAKSKKATIVQLPAGDGRTCVVEHNGVLIDRVIPPGVRCHAVDSVADLAAAATRWNALPVIWISANEVVLLPDDNDRRDSVRLSLNRSHVFRVASELKSSMDQAALIRLLRIDLRGAINQPAILAAVRKIKFRSLAAGHADIQHGNESLGQQIENEVTGADAIPESLVVSTNLYSNPGEEEFKFSIGLDLDIDAKNQRFFLRPMPDEIEKVTAAALDGIRQRIVKALPKVPVFYGRP